MDTSQREFLTKLLTAPSPTGYEATGQRIWLERVSGLADAIDHDAYGNAWATVRGTSDRTIMLEAHSDEIGFVVKYITEEGFLAVDRIGGSDAAIARGRRVIILAEGKEIPGVIAATAIHLRDLTDEKSPKVHELVVDVGAEKKKEVEKMGIRVGHPIIYAESVNDLGKHRIAGRAIDNRLGGYVLAEVVAALKKAKAKPVWTVYAVNAVQEEIGGYGAQMITHRLKPDIAVVLDMTHATDTPGVKHEQHGKVVLGGGPTLTHGAANHPAIIARFLATAKKRKIVIQHEARGRTSGTDTDSIYVVGDGIPSTLLSIPVRYMHTVVETADLRDIEKTVDLLTGFILSLQKKDTFSVMGLPRHRTAV